MMLLICGSRKLNDEATYIRLKEHLDSYEKIDMILHGDARGLDQMAGRYAKENEIPVSVIRPDYQRWPSRLAPLKRNDELVGLCSQVLAVYAPGRVRKGGTWYTVQKALAAGKRVTELLPCGGVRVNEIKSLFK